MNDIRGTWRCLSWLSSGTEAKDSIKQNLRIEITDDRYKVRRDGKLIFEGAYTKNCEDVPNSIDVMSVEGTGGRTSIKRGIFSFDGDSLVLCMPLFGEERPKVFASEKGSDIDLKVLAHVCGVGPSGAS